METADADQQPGRLARAAGRALDRLWPGHPRRWEELPRRLRATLGLILRLSTAAVLAFLLTAALTGVTSDLTGALTALLVVQATAYSTLRMGIVRVGAVLTGVLVAVLLSTWFGLSWWSLGIAVAASLLIARVLRLGDQLLEAPISAMLILAVHGDDVAVETRVVSTLIGAGVGMLFSLVLAPRVPSRAAASQLRRAGDAIAGVLRIAADSMRGRPIVRDEVERWRDTAREVGPAVSLAARRIAEIADARRLNPRAIGTANAEPLLRARLGTVERVLVAVQALFTVLHAEAPEDDPTSRGREDGFGEESRTAFAVVLDYLADCVAAFGALIEDEAQPSSRIRDDLAEALENLRESRAILTELMLVNAHARTSLWLLRGSVLAAVERALSELDVIERERSRQDEVTPLNQAPR